MALALPELLTKIFNFLAEVKALYPALFVSRLWFMCSGSILWRRIELIGSRDFGEKYEIQLKKFMGFLDRNTKPVYASKALIKISRAYPNLIYLNVFNNGNLTDNSIIELARGCPKLQNLEISWGGDITDRSTYEIARSCHGLRHLGINGGKNCIPDLEIGQAISYISSILHHVSHITGDTRGYHGKKVYIGDTINFMVLNFDDVSINALTGIFPSTRISTNMLNIFNKILLIRADFSTITEEFARLKINGNNHESQNTINVISNIVRQVSGKKILISLCQLLKIVRPEIQQDIINSII
ncbi:hypothetical protein Glove_43g35 [Diversispora epigaea]|uniref:F-box domain-containing protein n=1 Tax=Diversispora epigaea TaxID=1348612 RepID=A0A397JH24_9GLOM|nr:hypothetical protein Glove_43g35 [Diversispora epigaea]